MSSPGPVRGRLWARQGIGQVLQLRTAHDHLSRLGYMRAPEVSERFLLTSASLAGVSVFDKYRSLLCYIKTDTWAKLIKI